MKFCFSLFSILLASASWATDAQPEAKCSSLVEKTCADLWSLPGNGVLTLKSETKTYNIIAGDHPNEVSRVGAKLLQSLITNREKLPKDIREAFDELGVFNRIRLVLDRKAVANVTLFDRKKPEWNEGSWELVERAVKLVTEARLEQKIPGILNLRQIDVSPDQKWERQKTERKVWSEVFVTAWKNTPEWTRLNEDFERIREVYLEFIRESKFSNDLKNVFGEKIRTVQLRAPNENVKLKTDTNCGYDDANAFYHNSHHEVHVCAGYIAGGYETFRVLAHEMGHAIGIEARLLDYLKKSDYGQKVKLLVERNCQGKHFTCQEWDRFKHEFKKVTTSLQPYGYEDEKILERFVSKNLVRTPSKTLINNLALQAANRTVREEVDGWYLHRSAKDKSVLESGKLVDNPSYLNSCRASIWEPDDGIYVWIPMLFSMTFAEGYKCELDRGRKPSVAIERALSESKVLALDLWRLMLTVGGRYSGVAEAVNEGLAQDIEEDLVDTLSSEIVARILNRDPNVESRRIQFLASIVSLCERPSFVEVFPEEANSFRKFSNKPHSIGLERRLKLQTPAIKAALQCK